MCRRVLKIKILKITENDNEKDLSTQKETEKQGSRFQKENGYHRRQKGSEKAQKQGSQKDQRLTAARKARYAIHKTKKEYRLSETFQEGKKGFFPSHYTTLRSLSHTDNGHCPV